MAQSEVKVSCAHCSPIGCMMLKNAQIRRPKLYVLQDWLDEGANRSPSDCA